MNVTSALFVYVCHVCFSDDYYC